MLFVVSLSYAQLTKNKIDNTNPDDTKYVNISGTVFELSPIPNVVVFEKGKDNVVVTDKNGIFSITIPVEHFTENVYLRFEMLGIESVETQVYASTKGLKVQLNSSERLLSQKWHVEFIKPDIDSSEIIFKAILGILKNIKTTRH